MREPRCTVGYTWIEESRGHIPSGPMWLVTWLPNGYAPTSDDVLVCAFPDPQGHWGGFSVKDGERPPLIEAVVKAIEGYMQPADAPTAGEEK